MNRMVNDNKNNSRFGDFLVRFYGIFLFFVTAMILAYLTYQSARISMYSSNKYIDYNWPVEIPDSLIKNLLFCIFAILILAGITYISYRYPAGFEIFCNIFLVAVLLSYLIIGIIYVKTSPYYPIGDQINTTAGAAYALKGNFVMFSPLGYIGICPHQKGLLLFYEVIFKIFGSFNYTASSIINLVLNNLTILMGFFLIKEFKGSAISRFLWLIFSAATLPYFILIPYAYGDLPSIFGIMALVLFFKKYITSKKLLFLFISAVWSAFAILNRSSAWIAVFALIIISVLISIRMKKLYPLIGITIVSLFSYACLTAVGIGYEKASGYDRHTGSPTIAYIAMGMQETDGAAGVYNRYHQTVYEKYNGDKAATSAEARQYITEKIEEFKSDKNTAKDFYRRKFLMQWIEPMFEANTHMKSFADGTSLETLSPFYMSAYIGNLHILMFKFMNKFQTLVYLLLLIYALCSLLSLIKNKKEPDIYMWFFFTFILGGFLFSLIWEAKARYTLPYFIFMLPVISLLFTDAAAFLKSGNILKEKGHQQSL